MRTDPPRSLPTSNEEKPIATVAAEPPDEPPGVLFKFHGLFVTPNSSL